MKLVDAIALSRIGMATARGSRNNLIGTANGPPSYVSERKARKRGTQVRLFSSADPRKSARVRLEGRYEQLNKTSRAEVDALDWQPTDPMHPLVALARAAGDVNRGKLIDERRGVIRVGRPAPEHSAQQAANTSASPPEASDVVE